MDKTCVKWKQNEFSVGTEQDITRIDREYCIKREGKVSSKKGKKLQVDVWKKHHCPQFSRILQAIYNAVKNFIEECPREAYNDTLLQSKWKFFG